MAETTVKGLADIQALLNTLPAKLEANLMRAALRAAAKPVLESAKENVAVASGELRDGLKISTRRRGGTVSATVKASGPHAHIAPWIEYGTQPHIIPGPLSFGGIVISAAQHPGTSARPFMRPAMDANVQAAVMAAGEYLKRKLESKHGLDTSEILIEGDE